MLGHTSLLTESYAYLPSGFSVPAASLSPVSTQRTVDGIQCVAQPIAEQVEPEHGESDGDAREEHHPGIGAVITLRLVDHVAPGGRGRLHADADEAQRRLDEHGRGDTQRG